ncbi:hypothetical protein D3C86_1924190 [compost metagenome]
MLKNHGGEKAAELPFEEAQRRLLLALMEFNNETFYAGEEVKERFRLVEREIADLCS